MNPVTGGIGEFPSKAEADKEGYTIPLKSKPKPSCRRCYGRGYVGTNDKGEKVPCSCCT